MRSMKMVAMVAVLACAVSAYGQSYIVYTLETGGDNNVRNPSDAGWATSYEQTGVGTFTSGVTDGTTTVAQGDNLTWAIRVSTNGLHNGAGAGNGLNPIGAANLVFDLEVYSDAVGTLALFGAAPLVCSDNLAPNLSVTKAQCKPTAVGGGGFWSSRNDGDQDGVNGLDKWANAAFAVAIYNITTPPSQMKALNDTASSTPGLGGPNFDYGWYPTANGRSGTPISGLTPTPVVAPSGKLLGFGAGYKSYDATTYSAGVGKYSVTTGVRGFGANVGALPLTPAVAERPLFEGQISTIGLTVGQTYYIKVKPSQTGNNILHGNVVYNSATPNYGGFGSFAAKADNAVMVGAQDGVINFPAGVPFVVTPPAAPPTTIAGRKIFYNNSYYDGNKLAIDNPPLVGANNDDGDAIDTLKSPLMLGGGRSSFANLTGFAQGINGLIYDVLAPTRAPVVGDFMFRSLTRTGIAVPGPSVVPTFVTYPHPTTLGVTRCVMTFPSTGGVTPTGTFRNVWVQVDIGTGFGAPAETHFWANAVGDVDGIPDPNFLVNATDQSLVRANPKTSLSRAVVTFPYDVNKDSLVNATDQSLVRANPATSLSCVKFVTK